MIYLDALRSFDAVAVHDGLGAAARATRRPRATLSRHLADLERELGVRLVERGDRRLRLTEEGRGLHERTHGLLSDLDDAAEAVVCGSDVPRGPLRVSAPVVLAHVALMPIISRFCADHPEVTVDLVAEDRRADPVEDGFDVVIRIDPGPDERLVGRRLAYDLRLIVASPSVAMPVASGQVALPAVLTGATSSDTAWNVRTADGRVLTILPRGRLRPSSLLMARDAAIAGFGVALLPGVLVRPDIEAGRLASWGELDQPKVEIWALHPTRRLMSARVRAFLDALAGLGADRAVG